MNTKYDDFGYDQDEETDELHGLTVEQYADLFFDDDGNGVENSVLVPIPKKDKDLFFNSWDRGVSSLDTIAREIQEAADIMEQKEEE